MRRALVLVEGQTEEVFVNEILGPHLLQAGIAVSPTLICTKRVSNRRQHRGGTGARYSHIRRDVQLLLRDSDVLFVSTMIDYYGLPADFPGKAGVPPGTCFDRVAYLEEQFSTDIGHPRFIAHLVLHEFETLLFSSPSDIQSAFPDRNCLDDLRAIAQEFPTPEHIDESPDKSPSRRLATLFATYQKVSHGALISTRIGLESMRRRCKHFDAWVSRLEQATPGAAQP